MKKFISILFVACLPYIAIAQLINTVAGNGIHATTGDDSLAMYAEINWPGGVAYDIFGNFYFEQQTTFKVRKISPAGIITTVAGNGVTGFSGDGGLAVSAELNNPYGITTDSIGNLYIADGHNNRIRKVDIATGIINTIIGTGTVGSTGEGGLADPATLNGPYDICFDHFGNFYIAEFAGYRIRKVNPFGQITTVAGNGTYGFSGDGGPAIDAQLYNVTGICTDSAGNLYIADQGNQRVRKVNTAGIITTIAGIGAIGPSGDGGNATAAALIPWRVTVNNSGELFISCATNANIRKIDNVGVIHTIAGNDTAGYEGDGGPAINAEFKYPTGIIFDECGNLYVADDQNTRIRRIMFNPISTTPTPVVSLYTTSDTVCFSTLVTFTATFTGGGSNSFFRWYVNGHFVSDSTHNSYMYMPTNGDSVSCVLYTGNLCATPVNVVSNTIHMVVDTSITPSISVFAPATITAGTPVTVTATVVNAGSVYSIKWYDNGLLFATTTTNTATCTVSAGTNSITATVVPVLGSCYDSATTTGAAIGVIKAYNEGVTNVTSKRPVSIYPNPAHNVIVITSSNITSITIANTIGQMLISKNGNADEMSIDISSLPAGIYLVTVICDNGSRAVSKIVKQ